jgi:alpha-N-arabinofuranosidase
MNHIKIDPERILCSIDRNIFGGYLEKGIYNGIYSPDSPVADRDGLRTDVLQALKRMNQPNIRFGGNFFSGYRWIDGVGPRQERVSRHDLAWNSIVSNQFGTNEFIGFCRKLGAEPYMNVNCGDGDMREAGDWLEYCNGTGNSALANLRRLHGYQQPHKVKYWSIGNEVDGPWQIGYKTPQEYARAATELAKVMKWVDPDIQLVASAVSLWENNPYNYKTEWIERTRLILEQAGNHIDYLALHCYAHLHIDDPFETYMAYAADLNERLSAYQGLIKAVSLERGIKHNIGIAVDEWAVMRFNFRQKMILNLEDTLVTAQYLNSFIRHASAVRMANFPLMLWSIGINIARRVDSVLLESTFYPFELYCRTCGNVVLDVDWFGDTFSGTYLNREFKGIRTLDIAATMDEAKKQLVVYIINQSKDNALETTLSLTSGEFSGEVKASVINGPDIKAENTDENPNCVVTRENILRVSGKSMNFTFEPHSVTALECAIS